MIRDILFFILVWFIFVAVMVSGSYLFMNTPIGW